MVAIDPVKSQREPIEGPSIPFAVMDLGTIAYGAASDLQKQYALDRAASTIPNTLLLLEHPHTYTFGKSGKREHLLVPVEDLSRQGISVLDVDRGGDITYHGPGQLVVYPILRLRDYGIGIVQYLRLLESVLIELCAGLGITAQRIRGYTGAWIGDAKVAAIGAKVDVNGITHHGCALNVTTDLRYFAQIVPCGIRDKGVTSLSEVLGYELSMDQAKERFVRAFTHVCVPGPDRVQL